MNTSPGTQRQSSRPAPKPPDLSSAGISLQPGGSALLIEARIGGLKWRLVEMGDGLTSGHLSVLRQIENLQKRRMAIYAGGNDAE